MQWRSADDCRFGNFDWDAHADKFPGLTTPDESYHGVIYTQKFGKNVYHKATAQLMRDMGACQSPQNAFLTNVGLETLHLRVDVTAENAEKVAEFLKNHPKVAWVEYGRPCRQQIPCAGRKIHAERNLRRSLLRTKGRKRRRDALHERPENGSNCNTTLPMQEAAFCTRQAIPIAS